MTDLIKINAGFATIGQGAGPMMVTGKPDCFKNMAWTSIARRSWAAPRASCAD